MNGLYYHKEAGTPATLSLLRFYENGYVIYRREQGEKPYFEKILKRFAMDGHQVKGEPEYTFCGAYDLYGDSLSFAIENEVSDPSDSWVKEDVIRFKGSVQPDGSLLLTSVSKATSYEMTRQFIPVTEQELLNDL